MDVTMFRCESVTVIHDDHVGYCNTYGCDDVICESVTVMHDDRT